MKENVILKHLACMSYYEQQAKFILYKAGQTQTHKWWLKQGETVVIAKMVINKPKRNWNIGTQGQLIWGPHLLLLVAIWRKQDTEMGAISFLPALDGQHMLLTPCLSFFLQESNCNCIWNMLLISYIFLQLCFCSCFFIRRKWQKLSYMHAKHTLPFIFLWTNTHTGVCYQETTEMKRWKEGERGKINWCLSQEEKEACALKIQSSSVAAVYFWHSFPPRTPNATLLWVFFFLFFCTTWVSDIRFALSKSKTNHKGLVDFCCVLTSF